MNNTIYKAYKNGNLKQLETIYDNIDYKYKASIINTIYDKALLYAIKNGHIDIVKWLYLLDNKPIIYNHNSFAFGEACAYGKLDIAKWLLLNDSNNKKYNIFIDTIDISNDTLNIDSIENK